MYRTIDAAFWTDPKVRRCSPEAKLLILYLITNPHAHISGIYSIAQVTIQHEIGYPIDTLSSAENELVEAGFCLFDAETEVVWVKNMLRYQSKGEKGETSAANQLQSLHNSILIQKFLEFYPSVANRIPMGHRCGIDGASGVATQERERDEEMEEENGDVTNESEEIKIPTTDHPHFRATFQAFDRWSHHAAPSGRGEGIRVINNEHKIIIDSLAEVDGLTPIIRNGGESVPRSAMMAQAVEGLAGEGKPFKSVKYAMACAKGRLDEWARGGVNGSGRGHASSKEQWLAKPYAPQGG
jgi:hypothetical protein